MVNFDDDMGRQVASRAKAEKRSMSAHIVRLVERDLESAGLLPASAELEAAAAEVGGAKRAVEILQSAQRPKRATRKRALPALRRAA
jgi:hypothetical protein